MPLTGVPATTAAIYTTNAGQSIANNDYAIVDYEDKVQDTHDGVTTGAAWKFTAPAAGFYQVSAAVMFTATDTWADTNVGFLGAYVNGSLRVVLDRKNSYGSAQMVFMQLGGSVLVHLGAGDYIDIRVYQNSGAALALHNDGTYNRVSVVKV